MTLIRNVTGYEISRDYTKLADLMTSQSVVCLCEYSSVRDVAHTFYDGKSWRISARGYGYIDTNSREDFIAQCEKDNVEFLVPTQPVPL